MLNSEDERDKRIRERAKKALERYAQDELDCSAGFDILRFAKMGILEVKHD